MNNWLVLDKLADTKLKITIQFLIYLFGIILFFAVIISPFVLVYYFGGSSSNQEDCLPDYMGGCN